jgi:iron complex outermembrane receptor protein
MNNKLLWACALALLSSAGAASEPSAESTVDEITVFGQDPKAGDRHPANPVSLLTPADLVSINAATTEDLVKYEPSLVIRRRYIGDPNGTMGIRGSNMFQTTRSMVFADGIPLHYLLQTQWNGAPRWSLVTADEIGLVEVVYGPFSAEYGGNAMGGVVNIETRIPTERRFRVEGSMFQQSFGYQGFDDSMAGGRGFVSYGDRFGGFSIYGAWSRLQNDSQPMDYRFDAVGIPEGDETAVTGGLLATDEYGDAVVQYGNSGRQSSTTDQLKTKLGYEWGDWLALATIAYEERQVDALDAQNYLRDASGSPVWSGPVVDGGVAFEVSGSDFSVSEQQRRSLLLGGRVQGPLGERWWLEASASSFEILEDETRSSLVHPDDPSYTPAGGVSVFDDTGWATAGFKLSNDGLFGNDRLSVVTGYGYEHYRLGITNYRSDDYRTGERTTAANASGGETELHAAFAQFGWQATDRLDFQFGGRYETWRGQDGYYYDFGRDDLQDHDNRSESRFSPKFSAGFRPGDGWQLRYSLARAYRFPIVEELYQNERRTNGTSIANANLEPEDGLHHNLGVERSVEGGYVRVNLFAETVADAIFNQTTVVDNRTIRTFLPVDEVETRGTEFVFNRSGIAERLDVRFNVAYVDSEITRNSANPDLEGKTFPRMPRWRGHLLATWHMSDRWDIGGGARYASNSYGDLDNADTASKVFGAHDGYTQIDLKTNYRLDSGVRLSLGVDNLTNEVTFVHHPWPGRTLYMEAAVDL